MKNDLYTFAALLADLHNENGGASLRLRDAQKPEHGFMVSLRGYERKILGSIILGFEVQEYIRESVSNARRLNAGDLFVGTWFDGACTYFDLSLNIADLGTALQVARENKQQAIFDVSNNQVIVTIEFADAA